ncbi:MAG: carboxypeptidase regulatory-like domain-containing protein [Bacteroidales bacterium]|nr:carboxypeptidase regulatory-like domain-containing protein [Bacteroidales bacterium]
MKKLLFLMLVICCACDSWQTQVGKHLVSGVISDMEGSHERLMTGVHAVVTNNVGKQVYSGDVIPEGTVGGSYSIGAIPQGEYEIVFQGKYYKPRAYVVSVSGDTELDVELEPIHVMAVEQDEIRFGSRVGEQTLTIRNMSETAIDFGIRTDLPMGDLMFLEMSAPGLKPGDRGWNGTIAPMSALDVDIKILRASMENIEGVLHIFSTSPYNWERFDVPVAIETSEKDIYANLRGTVKDAEGKPLEGVAVWNNCTETITFTDSNGEYSFDALPSISMVRTEVYSEYHAFQTRSEEYAVKEFVMDFTLEPVQKHITFDKKHIDFGEGRIVEGAEKEKIEVNATSDTGEMVTFSIVSTTREADFAVDYNPASGVIKDTKRFVFSLARERSAGLGEYMRNLVVRTEDAGSYVFEIRYTNIE